MPRVVSQGMSSALSPLGSSSPKVVLYGHFVLLREGAPSSVAPSSKARALASCY